MREEYDFSKGKKNPYAKQLKKQVDLLHLAEIFQKLLNFFHLFQSFL